MLFQSVSPTALPSVISISETVAGNARKGVIGVPPFGVGSGATPKEKTEKAKN
jgi:hypothetical protein